MVTGLLCKPSLFLDYSKNITLTSLFTTFQQFWTSFLVQGAKIILYYQHRHDRGKSICIFHKGFLFKEVSFELLFIPSPTKLRRDIVTLPSIHPSHPCEHSRIDILQWILTKLGTYLVLKRIWNPIDFTMSKVNVTWSNFYHVASL